MSKTNTNFEAEILERVKTYAAENGRGWDLKLSRQWANGSDSNERDGHLLRRARNRYGYEIIRAVKEGQ